MNHLKQRSKKRLYVRGSMLVIMGLGLVAFLGFSALAVDLGYVLLVKNELQNVSDAAALGAATEIRNGETAARAEAINIGQANSVAGTNIIVDSSDVIFGNYDFATSTFSTGGFPTNAAQVTARRTEASPSGSLGLFFARMFNQDFSNVSARTLTGLDGRIVGVKGVSRTIPFGIYEPLVVDANGDFEIGNEVTININTPGNFGWLDLDGGSNSTSDLVDWIENGFDQDLIVPVGGFLSLEGSPGAAASLKNALESIVGESVFLPVFDFVGDAGAGTDYHIVSFMAAELTDVHLQGNPNSWKIDFDIIEFASSVLAIDETAPDNNSLKKPRILA